MTYIQWDGGAGTSNWMTAANWAGDVIPGTADKAGFKTATGAVVSTTVPTFMQMTLSGHVHYYSRVSVPFSSSQYPPWGDVQHVTSGGGADLYTPVAGQPNVVAYSRSLDVVKVVISGDTLTGTAVSETGTVLDTFTVTLP